MKKLLFILSLSLLALSCTNKNVNNYTVNNLDSVLTKTQNQANLAQFIFEHNNFIASEQFPPIVLADYVNSELSNDLIIDLRQKQDYEKGHIKGAINLSYDKLIDFLNNKINSSAYKHIVLVSYTGQTATFAATLLHLAGWNNAFALKYGMAGWNKDFADVFKGKFNSKFIKQVDTQTVNKPKPGKILSSSINGLITEIITNRSKELLSRNINSYFIDAETVFSEPEKYFIIDLRRPVEYKKGHIPGAVNYYPSAQLSFDQYLSTIPTNKPIAVYCYYGYTSAGITAYLRLLGYEAYSIKFGAHGFIDKLFEHPFNPNNAFKNYPYIKGDKPFSK